MEEQKEKPDCYKCKHRGKLIGDCHSSCKNTEAKVSGNKHGIKSGWFFHPFNFDPIWLEECDGFENKEKESLITENKKNEEREEVSNSKIIRRRTDGKK